MATLEIKKKTKSEIEAIIDGGLTFRQLAAVLDRAGLDRADDPAKLSRVNRRMTLRQVYRIYRDSLQDYRYLDLPVGKLGRQTAMGVLEDFGGYYDG